MMENEEHVFDVHTEEEFERLVIAASSEHVVVVDFWAPWCAPCRTLGPVLEKVVQSFHGKAVLGKVNIDENQSLARKWRIRSIPAVKIYKSGKVVKEFIGALPENELRRELSSMIPSEADELVAEGDKLAQQGDIKGAEGCFRKAIAVETGHPSAAVRLARIAFDNGNYEEVRELAESVSGSADEHEEAEGILARIDFSERCKKEGGRVTLGKRLAKEPENLDLMYALACCLASEKKHKDALDHFLKIIEKDKHYQDDAAKTAMVRIFSIVGQRSELADEYRERLTRQMYS